MNESEHAAPRDGSTGSDDVATRRFSDAARDEAQIIVPNHAGWAIRRESINAGGGYAIQVDGGVTVRGYPTFEAAQGALVRRGLLPASD